MAQFGSAQREPSMEEILASIRRIIEDSDTIRKADEGSSGRIAEDNTDSVGLQSRPESAATVIEVEAFRSEARARSTPFDSTVEAGGADAPAEADGEDQQGQTMHASIVRPLTFGAGTETPPRRVTAPEDWRLGVAPQSAQAAVPDAFDEAIANAVMSDLSESAPEAPATVSGQPAQSETSPALLSDAAGRQVSAAFGELNEALAARSRRNLDEMAEALLRPMLQEWLDNNLPMLVEKLVRQEIERVARGS